MNLIHKELAMIQEAENQMKVQKAAHVAANLDEMKAAAAKDRNKFDAVLKAMVTDAKGIVKMDIEYMFVFMTRINCQFRLLIWT